MREKEPIVEQTKYNSDSERQGETTNIEIGEGTKGLEGFTLTRRCPLGLLLDNSLP